MKFMKGKRKNIFMRYKYIVMLFSVLLISFFTTTKTYALDMNIIDATIIDKSSTITTLDPTISDNSITSNIVFNKVNDYVTYQIQIKNNDNEKYYIDSITDNNKNNNIKITYEYETIINSNDITTITIKLSYDNELLNVEKISINDLSIILNLSKENGSKEQLIIINPKTGDNLYKYLILFILSITSLILIRKKYRLHNYKLGNVLLVLTILLFPFVSFARINYKFNFVFDRIEIKGRFEVYDVVINPNDGGSLITKQITYGEKIGDLPNIITRDGYEFDKWVDETGKEITEDTIVTSSLSIKAKFNLVNYSLSYNLDGGKASNKDSYNIETEDFSLNNPTRKDYVFTGWSGTDLTGNNNTIVTITKGSIGNRNYTANWTERTYKIIFDSNTGTGSMNDEVLKFNESKELPSNLYEKENWTFIGWNTKRDGTGKTFLDNDIVENLTEEESITLYAMWSEDQIYFIKYNPNKGEGQIKSERVNIGENHKLKKNPFTNEDYVFLEWNTKPDGTGTSYQDEEEVIDINSRVGEVINLYAIWVRERYIYNGDIVFDGTNYIDTGIKLFSSENLEKNFEISFEIKSRDENKAHNTMMSCMDESGNPYPGLVYRVHSTNYDQMAINASEKEKIENNYNVKVINKVSIKRIDGTIYFEYNGVQPKEMLNMSVLTTPFDIPVTFGASLDGSKNPFRYFKGTLSNLKVIITDSENRSIKYNANGGTGNIYSQTIKNETSVKLMKNTYIKEGYVFKGWNTQKNGQGIHFDEEEIVNLDGLGKFINLYAEWKKFNYTVEYNSNGGEGSMSSQSFSSTVAQKLYKNTFTKDGYKFAFWNTKSDASGISYQDEQQVNNIGTTENEVVTLYAIYEKNSYQYDGDIVFDGTNVINTELYLFSENNINKDFEISFEIKNTDKNNAKNTLISAIDETGSPWPGFVFRVGDNTRKFNFAANSTISSESNTLYDIEGINKVVIKRVSNVLYLKINDGEDIQIIDYSNIKKKFSYPVTIGGSLDANFNPQRLFKGTLSNIKIQIFD